MVANYCNQTVGVLLGNGDGGFSPATTFYCGGAGPAAITVADLDGNGTLDLAVTNYESRTLGILFGDGNGGFSAPTIVTCPGAVVLGATAVGDFNRDGKNDLAITCGDSVGILLGDGKGGFSFAGKYYSAGGVAVAAGDFNGDGKLDLAVSDYEKVGILLGDGNGGFSPVTVFPSGMYGVVRSLAVADFNGDGKQDLALGSESDGEGNAVGLLLGDGNGGFASPITYATCNCEAVAMAAVDFNGDGKPDLAAVYEDGDIIVVLTNIYEPAPVCFTSPHSYVFDLSTGSSGMGELINLGNGACSNALNGYGRLMIGGALFQPSTSSSVTSDDGQSVLTGDGTFSGLTVSRKITVPNTGDQDFARTIDTFTNPTASPITTMVQIIGNLGSDAATTVFATSNGTNVGPGDQWIGTDGNGTPAIIHYIHGPGGLRPASVSLVGDNIQWTYNITVPAGQTVQLAYFTIIAATRAEAVAAAKALVGVGGFGGQAAAFLSSDDVAAIGNFQFPPTFPVTINQATSQPDSTNGWPIHFTVVFSEPVTDFATGDVSLTGTAGASIAIVTPIGSDGMTYDVAASGMTGSGTVIASIAAGVAQDADGNPNADSTSDDNSVDFVVSGTPTFTITGPTSGTYAPGQPITITWTANNISGNKVITLCLDQDTKLWNGNERWIEVDKVAAANCNGTYIIDPGNFLPGTYFVGGYMYDKDTRTFTESHATSTITIPQPLFTITGPTSGTYAPGQNITISWDAENVSANSVITLCLDQDTKLWNGNERWIEVDKVAAANGAGSYTFDPGNFLPGTYCIGGYMYNKVTHAFTNSCLASAIAIPSPTFVLNSVDGIGPDGLAHPANPLTITWTAANVSANDVISLCLDSDTTLWNGNEKWIEIDKATAANGNGSYTFHADGFRAGPLLRRRIHVQ